MGDAVEIKQRTAYVAGPLGFAESSRLYLRKELYPRIEGQGFKILDPWSWQIGMSNREIIDSTAKGTPIEIAMRIGEQNIKHIADTDIVVAVLDGADVDSGTAGEIGNAHAKGKPVFALRSDFRLSGDSDLGINLQILAFIRLSGGDMFRTTDELIEGIKRYLRRENEKAANQTLKST